MKLDRLRELAGITEAANQPKKSKEIFVDTWKQLITLLKRDPAVKAAIGKNSLYFDDADLVLGDKTVMSNIIGDDGSIDDIDAIKKAVIKTAKTLS